MERWKAIVTKFASVRLSEEYLFCNYHKEVLELFHSKIIKISESNKLSKPKMVTDKVARH